MDKPTLRQHIRAKLVALPPLERSVQEELVNGMLMEASEGVSTLLLYKAKPPELSLVSMTNAAFREGLEVVMPRVNGRELELRCVQGWGDLERGAFGIEEPGAHCKLVDPRSIQFAAIPGLAWTVDGGRLGQGGGFYDKLLPKLDCKTFGVAFDCQMVPEIPLESHDISVSEVCFAAKLWG